MTEHRLVGASMLVDVESVRLFRIGGEYVMKRLAKAVMERAMKEDAMLIFPTLRVSVTPVDGFTETWRATVLTTRRARCLATYSKPEGTP